MSRCHICDSEINDLRWNAKYEEFDPCHVCLEKIKDAVGGKDVDEMSDEEVEPTIEELLEAHRIDVV